ncbi:hypothetical protein [Namhaeicola litoreus]|uniref:Vitellogenin II n=1 Tax=Namhaeicola litoreus TaxID=1052145 RepID=A0ABW3Y0Y8_9FLAO
MKNFTPKKKNKFYFLSAMFLGLFFASCTSTQGVYSDNDGIYGSSPTRVVTAVQEVPGANYQRYFETEANNIYIEEDDIFTDIDGYVGYSDADQAAVQIEGDYNYGNTPWGYNDSNVSINFHMGFGYGGYWGYNPWRWGYGGYWGWNDPWYGWGWGYPGFGWGYPGYGWGYPGYGWGYPGYGWGYPIYRPPYYSGSYGKRNNYPVRYANNGNRTGYTRTSQSASTRPNIYKNSVAQNASSNRSTNYRRSSSNAVNNSYQRYNQQNSNRNTNGYNRNSNSSPSYSPSMGRSSGFSRGSSGGMRSSSGGRRNGPNVVSNDQGTVDQIQSNSRNYRSTGRPVNSDFKNTLNSLRSQNDNASSLTRYEWRNGQAYRVNLDNTQRQEIVNKIRNNVDLINEGQNRNYSNGPNSNRAKSYNSKKNRQSVETSSAKSNVSSQKSSRATSVSNNSTSSPSRNASSASSSRSSSSGSSYARSSSGGGSRTRQ